MNVCDRETFVLEGIVKWQSTSLRYGFATTDREDVKISASILSGKYLVEGTVVRMSVERGKKGLYATQVEIISIPGQIVPEVEGLRLATVKWFNRLKGFGFVICEGEKRDIMIHAEECRAGGIDPASINPNDQLLVLPAKGPKGLRAEHVRRAV